MLPSKNAETTLYAELIRRGLPADYARRTAEELDDHRADLLADLRASKAKDPAAIANERLGETRQLAKKIARDYRRRTWIGRWPLLSCVLLPPALLLFSWAIVVLGLLGLGSLVTLAGGEPGTIWSPVAYAKASWILCLVVFAFLVPAGIAWLVSRVALKTTRLRYCALLAVVGVGFLNSLPHHEYRLDPEDPTLAMNLISIPICDPIEPAWFGTSLRQLRKPILATQLAVPILVGGLVIAMDERRRRVALLSPTDTDGEGRLAA